MSFNNKMNTRWANHSNQSNRKGIIWLGALVFLLFTTAAYVRNFQLYSKSPAYRIDFQLDDLDPFDPSQKCSLPRIHPFDPSIIPFLSEPRPIVCKVRQGSLTFVDDDGYLRYNRTAMEENGYGKTTLSCTYRLILRPNGDDDNVAKGPENSLPPDGVKLDGDYAEVMCSNFAGFNVYSYIHAHVKPISNPNTKNFSDQHFNVFFLGLDSVSRLAMMRHLPKTYRYLTEDMGSYVFRGMTKIGDNTFPNLAAVLTGLKVGSELPETGDFGPDWPFLWKDFKRLGYSTMFAEDQPHIGLFNYLRNGLKDPPTDHYLRPYWLSVEKSAVHRLSSSLCYGNTPKHLLQLNHARDFLKQYQKLSRPSFGFSFLVELSHDYLCKVSVADNDFANWLEDLNRSSLLNRTVLFFFSDHGHRFDAIRQTLVGRLEERLPFFSMYVPPELLEQQPHIADILKTNSGRLTSTFDAYYTAMDLLLYANSSGQHKLGDFRSDRGKSLFGPILSNRTCENAGIPPHYCVCEETVPLEVNDVRSIGAATAVLNTLNDLISVNQTACGYLTLKDIKNVELVKASDDVMVNKHDYFGKMVKESAAVAVLSKLRLTVEVSPSGGLFEATVTYRTDDAVFSADPDISRINKYGNQSWCVRDSVLRKYCFCKQQEMYS